METTDSSAPSKSETVSEPNSKKTRKFTWTDKRKAQFEKMTKKNLDKKKDRRKKRKKE